MEELEKKVLDLKNWLKSELKTIKQPKLDKIVAKSQVELIEKIIKKIEE